MLLNPLSVATCKLFLYASVSSFSLCGVLPRGPVA